MPYLSYYVYSRLPDLAEVNHHIIKYPRIRKLNYWDVLFILFGIRKKEEMVICHAEVARPSIYARKWIL